jgi:hypothetical protein
MIRARERHNLFWLSLIIIPAAAIGLSLPVQAETR